MLKTDMADDGVFHKKTIRQDEGSTQHTGGPDPSHFVAQEQIETEKADHGVCDQRKDQRQPGIDHKHAELRQRILKILWVRVGRCTRPEIRGVPLNGRTIDFGMQIRIQHTGDEEAVVMSYFWDIPGR